MTKPGRIGVRAAVTRFKESTDSSLLAIARFFGLLYGPIARDLPIDEALAKSLRYRLPRHGGWRHALGGVTYLLFLVLVVTGTLLALYYRPSAQEAYYSLEHIVTEVSFGWLIRDVHAWSANLLVVFVLLHMARVFFDAAYKPPRESNWLVGLVLLAIVLAFGATGYLLPWDQWAYWSVTELLAGVAQIPLIGRPIGSMLTGDVIVSGATLSRYFALHVIVLPWLALGALGLHFLMLRKHGLAPPQDDSVKQEGEGVQFFPHHLLRSFMVSVVVLAVVISLAALFPRPMTEAASPSTPPEELVSTWVLVDISLVLFRYLGPWGFTLFTLFGLSLALLPLFDRSPERRLRRRPVAATFGVAFFVGMVVAWGAARRLVMAPTATVPPEVIEERGAGTRPLPLPRVGPTPIRPTERDTATGRDR